MAYEPLKRIIRPIYWLIKTRINRLNKQTPVFIVGCGHSGTTLILRILSEHIDLYSIDRESSVFGKNYINYKEMITWTKEMRKLGKKSWIEKTPGHIHYLDKIFMTFPYAKVIVMIRDGRDVAISIKKRTNDFNYGLNRWINDNNAWKNYESDERVLQVKLEDFTKDTENSLKNICTHINVKYTEDLLNYQNKEFTYQNSGIAKTDGRGANHQQNRNWQVNQEIFKDTSRWKDEALEEEMSTFNKNEDFNKLMIDFNYTEEK